jgi:hypothetical protein
MNRTEEDELREKWNLGMHGRHGSRKHGIVTGDRPGAGGRITCFPFSFFCGRTNQIPGFNS